LDGRPAEFSMKGKEIDLSGNAPGLYIVKVKSGERSYFSQVFLQQ